MRSIIFTFPDCWRSIPRNVDSLNMVVYDVINLLYYEHRTYMRKSFYGYKRYSIRMSQNFHEMFDSSGGNKNIELGLSTNLRKVNLKEAIAIDT